MNLLDQQVFENKTKEFVRTNIQYEGAEVVKSTHDYKSKNLDVYLIGRPVPKAKINEWLQQLQETDRLQEVKLRIFQGADQSGELAERLSGEVKAGILEDLYVKNEQLIQNKDERIRFLEDQIAFMKFQTIPFEDLSKELKINYQGVESFSYSNKITTNFEKTDTLPVINIKWKRNVTARERKANLKKISEWFKYKLKLDTLEIHDSR